MSGEFYWVAARLLVLVSLLAAIGSISMGRRCSIPWMFWNGVFLLVVDLAWAVILVALG